MSLEASVKLMVERLCLNQGFPKYQFERSLNGFLSLFLIEYFSKRTGDTFVYVAAEFPLRKEQTPGGMNENYQSTNVDYLLLRKGPPPQWYFVELKTDKASQRDAQLERLQQATGASFSTFFDEIAAIKTRSRQGKKYDNLIRAVEANSTPAERDGRISSVCLTGFTPATETVERFNQIEWIELSTFDAMMQDTQHPELWALVKPLFAPESGTAR